jgi:transcriptional regulator with XRE-family HTH domain
MAEAADNDGMPSFRENLEYLFDHRRRPDGQPYSNEDVASAIRDAGGEITSAYLSALRRGERDDPRISYVRWLAGFFRVPGGFFLDRTVNDRVRARLDTSSEADRLSPPGRLPGVLYRDFNAMSPRSQDLLAGIMRAVDEWDRDDEEWDDETEVVR